MTIDTLFNDKELNIVYYTDVIFIVWKHLFSLK